MPQPACFAGILGPKSLDMVAPLPHNKREAIKQRLEEATPHIRIIEEMSLHPNGEELQLQFEASW